MAFPQRSRLPYNTGIRRHLKPTHGEQCTCAVCSDVTSNADSDTFPRGRLGGSVTGQSLGSGSQPHPTGEPTCRCSASNIPQRPPENTCSSSGPSSTTADAGAALQQCVPVQDESVRTCIKSSNDYVKGGRDSGVPEVIERPTTPAKSKAKKTPSSNRQKVPKGAQGGSADKCRGAQKPRPLCVVGNRDKSISDDECDLDADDGNLSLEQNTFPEQMTELNEETYDKTVAETTDGDVSPYLPPPCEEAAGPPQPPPMDAVGPWAVGKTDWTPLAGLTGTRPIVDRYTITRYSEAEWRQRNFDTMERAAGDTNRATSVAFNARACMSDVLAAASRNGRESTLRLQQRNAEVKSWLVQVKKSHQELWDDMKILSVEDDRLRRILCVLEDIVHLVGESIQLRSARMEPDLTNDAVDREMTKELGLVNEIRQLLERTRGEIRTQMDASRSAKQRIEQDIADKELATGIDCQNIQLRYDSPTIMFHEGAARFMNNQSTPESWEVVSRENLNIVLSERAKMQNLRAIIERVLKDSNQDLLIQKAVTEDAIMKHIAVISGVIADLESRRKWVLKSIVETEALIQEIKETVRKLDYPLKVTQTRLKGRQDRPSNENTRDCPQYALVDEMKSIGEQATAMLAQLEPAEEALVALFKTRSFLETELQSKKKNLFIDRDRIMRLRQNYPPTEALMTNASSQCLPCR